MTASKDRKEVSVGRYGNMREEDNLLKIYHDAGLIVLPERRTIYINDAITSTMSALFNLALLDMENSDGKSEITVYINSPGGEVTAGMSMIDTMMTIQSDVRTVCVGQASSMGALILMAGTKGKREILPHSYVLIHQILGGTGSMMQAADIEIYAENISKRKKELFSFMADMTGRSIEKIEHDCDRNYTLSAAEAVEYGIVDAVVRRHGGER